MPIDVIQWLRGLGLEQYATPFRDNDIDGEILAELTAEDLIGLGIGSIGHRRKLLTAIASLRESDSPTEATAAAVEPPPPSVAEASPVERRQLTILFCDLVGETPNLAARLQGLAAPNTVVVADNTRRQLGTLFEFQDLGPQLLKGFAGEQRVWRVIGESGVASRFAALRTPEAPLIGRDEELELLVRRWSQAKAGEGRVVLLSADAGIGKSRLTEAL